MGHAEAQNLGFYPLGQRPLPTSTTHQYYIHRCVRQLLVMYSKCDLGRRSSRQESLKGDPATQSETSCASSVGIAAEPGSKGTRPEPLASVSVDVCHVREFDMIDRIDFLGHAMRMSSMPNA